MSKPIVKFISSKTLGKCPKCEVLIHTTKFGWTITLEFEDAGYDLTWSGTYEGNTRTGIARRYFGWYVSTGKGEKHKRYGKIEIHNLESRDMFWTTHQTKYGEINCLIRHSQAFPERPFDVQAKNRNRKTA